MSIFDGVAARWGLDELSGVDAFDSFGSLDGIASGADIETSIVKLGAACRDFDGVEDIINFGNILAYERTDPFSFAFWVYPRASLNNQIIDKITQSDLTGYEIGIVSGKVLFSLFGGSSSDAARITSTTGVTLNAWNCVVVTYDGSSLASGMEIYVNDNSGHSVTKDTLSASIDGGHDLIFGERPGNTIDYNGFLDEVVPYDKELTALDASEFWNGGAGQQVLPPPSAAGRRRKILTGVH